MVTLESLRLACKEQAALKNEVEQIQRLIIYNCVQGEQRKHLFVDELVPHNENKTLDLPKARATILAAIYANWNVVALELEFATQGGTALMQHPGYSNVRGEITLLPPLRLEDITLQIIEDSKQHVKRLEETIKTIKGLITETTVSLAAVEQKIADQKQLDVNLNELRAKRKVAIAAEQSIEDFTTQINKITEQLHKQGNNLALWLDEAEGLHLRKLGFEKALEKGTAAVDLAIVELQEMILWQGAHLYNTQAQTKLFKIVQDFTEMRDSLQQSALEKGIKYLAIPHSFEHTSGNVCLPIMQGHWILQAVESDRISKLNGKEVLHSNGFLGLSRLKYYPELSVKK